MLLQLPRSCGALLLSLNPQSHWKTEVKDTENTCHARQITLFFCCKEWFCRWNTNADICDWPETPVCLSNVQQISHQCIPAGMSQTSFTSLRDDRLIGKIFPPLLKLCSLRSCGIILMFYFLLLFSTHTHFLAQSWTSRPANDNILRAAHISCHCTFVMEEIINVRSFLLSIGIQLTQIKENTYSSTDWGHMESYKIIPNLSKNSPFLQCYPCLKLAFLSCMSKSLEVAIDTSYWI